ncbi:MAG TPA: helix-turn-helix domain-containing protein, partial [Deinococcales bacterium]|nr:helix-turn-helix domain-containing protein [Deinococcales bacterium]
AQRLGRQAHRMAVCHALTRRGDLRTRTAHYLLGLAASPLAALEDDESVWIRGLTHEMIGSAVGCIRVHATRVLRSLEEEGLLSTAYRSVRLLDVPGLYKAAGADSDVSARMLSALFGGEDSREGVAASVIETLLASRTQGLRGALA